MSRLKHWLPSVILFAPAAAFGAAVSRAPQGGRSAAPDFFSYLLRPKFLFMFLIGIFALVLLTNRRMTNRIKIPLLLLSTFLFGVAGNLGGRFFSAFAMHPSPVCAVTKPLLYGFRMPFIVTLSVILLLTLIGPKLFCGWVCPVGAIQELLAMLADKLHLSRLKPRFRLYQSIRIGIFLLFVFVSATAVLHTVNQGRVVSQSLYDFINPFHGLELQRLSSLGGSLVHYLPFLLTMVFALKVYRPFCHFVCPIGLFANLLEPVALFRVRLNVSACTQCRHCERTAPCAALPEILKGSVTAPDCFSCGVCLQSCPQNALGVRLKNKD